MFWEKLGLMILCTSSNIGFLRYTEITPNGFSSYQSLKVRVFMNEYFWKENPVFLIMVEITIGFDLPLT